MSGAIEYFLDFIERSIPSKLLEITFRPDPKHGINNVQFSVRERIRQEVINDWLVRDINTKGIQDIVLPLSTAVIRDAGRNQLVIHIPRSATGGRRIVSISRMGFFNPYAVSNLASLGAVTSTEMQRAISKMVTSVSAIPRVETGYITLINENTFLVEDFIMTSTNFWVGVSLEADEYLSNIKPAYYDKLAEFALMACKAVIYRKMVNDRDGSIIEGGHELGSLNDLVNNWTDADEQYQDMRRMRLKKILSLNDKNTKLAQIKSIVS